MCLQIAVTCEGIQYKPDITNIQHCTCEQNADNTGCAIFEESISCLANSCTTTALFKSTVFTATLSDFLQGTCAATSSLDKGRFITTIAHIDG